MVDITSTAAVDSGAAGAYAHAMQQENETELIARARAGCEQSFAAIVTQHSPRLIRLAWRLLGNRSDAEDLVQEAFLRLHRSLGGFRGDSLLSTWLYRTVTRLAIDNLRRETMRRKLFFLRRSEDDPDPLDQVATQLSGQDDQLAARQQVALLRHAVTRLSPRQRAILTLRHQEELPLKEIAGLLGISEGSVKVHLHRAVQALRLALDEKETES